MPYVDQPPDRCGRCRGRLFTESDGRRYDSRSPEYACLSCGARYYLGPHPASFIIEPPAEARIRRRQPSHGQVKL